MHRAYHALPPLTSRDGRVVNAVYGFFGMMFRVTEDLKPTHFAVAFDTEKPTFRHAAYVGYQAQRPRLESDLADQISLTQELLIAGGISVFIAPGYEAEDIIGTLAAKTIESRWLKVEGGNLKIDSRRSIYPQSSNFKNPSSTIHSPSSRIEIIIVTGDRDLLQLVNKRTKVCLPVHGLTETHILDEAEVKNYIGVTPAQIIDYKALVGDQSDNYPGVAGVGPKTASTLLAQYKNFEGVYKNLKKLAPNLVAKLSEGHDSGVLSRDLATIRRDVPVAFDLEKMEFHDFRENESLVNAFAELGFKSLVARARGVAATRAPKEKKQKEQMELV